MSMMTKTLVDMWNIPAGGFFYQCALFLHYDQLQILQISDCLCVNKHLTKKTLANVFLLSCKISIK